MSEKKLKMVEFPENIEDIELDDECCCDDTYHYLEPIIPVDSSQLKNIKFDAKAFQDGIDSMSCFAGKITALLAIGLPIEFAFQCVMELTASNIAGNFNTEIAKLQADANAAVMLQNKQTEKKAEI